MGDGKIQIFSRNQEDNTTKYPDIIQRFSSCKLDNVKSCVIDSEAVAWDREKKQIQPFQVLSTRKRKDATESEIKVQVAVFAFDILYVDGPAAPPVYGFEYAVADDYSHANFAANEARDGYKTTGSYRVALPDGRTQVVNYHVDDAAGGYVADVTYEGVAAYPPAPAPGYRAAPAPAYHAAAPAPAPATEAPAKAEE